ncbi:MAG TPA: glycosyltransferase family 39 protein [Anaerolineae bacterium]|nr:glycosyltransferase family 39 protein [Anaerolineae bacterium]
MTGCNRLHLGTWLAALVLVLANVVIWATDSLVMQAVAGVALLILLPGALIAGLLFGQDASLDAVERTVLAVGLGYACLVLGVLLLHYLPGPLTRTLLLAPHNVLVAVLILLRALQSAGYAPGPGIPRPVAAALLLLVIVAALFRFVNLGYSEFQGDEGRAMLRAAEVLQGYDQVLFLHKKGPVEILLPAATYALAGRIDEWTARLPFALANLAALVALFVLGRRAFGSRVGLLAAGLMSIDGYSVAFARIVQYQSIVLLTTFLALFCVYRALQSPKHSKRYLMAAAVLAGTGLLAHYEGLFALPGMAYLVWAALRREPARLRQVLRQLAPPITVGGVLVGSFYLPFLLHPNFQETAAYLTEKRIGGTPLYNNIADFSARASLYSASYYIILLAILLAVGALALLLRAFRTWRGRAAGGVLATAWLTILFFPQWWQIGTINLSVIVFLATLAALLMIPARTEVRLLQLWFGVTALFFFFLMLKVHTHYYVALPAWWLIAGLVMSRGHDKLVQNAKPLRWVGLGAAAALWLVCAGYTYIVFVRHTPEYLQTRPPSKPWLYWTPFGPHPPGGGYFGFPRRTAWKAVGALYDARILKGAYDSNEKDTVTNWYTRGTLRCPQSEYFIVARDAGSPDAVIPEVITGEYMPPIEILRDGEPQLWVFQRGYEGELVQYDFAQYEARFDTRLSASESWFGVPLDEIFEPSHLVNAQMGGESELVGWDISSPVVAQGDSLILTLYWRALAETDADYHVFAHIGADDPIVAHDSVPRCGEHPTYRWQIGEQVVDRHLLIVRGDAAPGVLPVWVGMYDIGTKHRLPVTDAQGTPVGDTLQLTQIRVGEPDYVRPGPAHPRSVTIGRSIRLRGCDVTSAEASPGETIDLTLYWECLAPMETSYTVFVHLLGPDGRLHGQQDSVPWGGRLPTTHWVAGEVITDEYVVPVSQDAPTGAYTLLVGMYDVRTGVRLAALDGDGTPLANNAVPIGQVPIHE